MAKRVLFVDDEPNVLQSIRRSLRKQFEIDTAEGGEAALSLLNGSGEYAVIVSDMRMPGMNGVELLAEARRQAPDTVRMMLTGNADQQTAVDAVNHGDIFRFLNKPCAPDDLATAVASAVRQHDLITAEKELLEQTLRQSIHALADVLALSAPDIYGGTSRRTQRVRQLSEAMALGDTWELESAAMLCLTGCVAISQDLVRRKLGGHRLDAAEYAAFAEQAVLGADIVAKIPRMEQVAEAIRFQEKHYDGGGFPAGGPAGDAIPLGARVLKIVLDYDALEASGAEPERALEALAARPERYDPKILKEFRSTMRRDLERVATRVAVTELTDGMEIAEDLLTADNVLLIAKGQSTTLSVRRHLQNYRERGLIGNELLVYRG
ncbi:MAG: response regulator [Woeseiaceae bacterium]|nr:response regulator [Woeseiaceae bacterium]